MDGTTKAELSGQEEPLSILNPHPKRIPGPRLLHHLVPRDSTTRGQPALDHLYPDGKRRELSFEELDRLSDTVAAQISRRRQSALSEDPFIVPILIPQSPELYVSLLAVLKAGGAFCPLNLDVPPERLAFILGDVSATVVLTTLEGQLKFANQGVEVISVDQVVESPEASDEDPGSVPRDPRPEDLAYVMYTSGSTGTPKGVGICHDAATQSLLSHDRHIPQFSRFLQFAAPTFDVSVFEIFFPLFRGRTLVSCTRSELLNNLPAIIQQMNVDACELTPTVAGSLLRTRKNAPCLRILLTIGEMMTEGVLEEFGGTDERESMLWAMYGPTEATIHCTLQPAIQSKAPVACIGIPLDTTSAYILEIPDDSQKSGFEARILPLGAVGELAVGGYQLADCYLNRPEQTRNAFIEAPHGRLYRTGDKARLHPDGFLECLGRISEGQVKLRGQRIELGEIEQAAGRAKGCHGVVASVISGVLVVFCLVDASDEAEARIIDACRSWLPAYMVPDDIMQLDEFPRLPSGKVDRKSLRDMYASKRDSMRAGAEEAATDDTLDQLRQAAEKVLDVPVRASEKLAFIGMDSLRAIQYAALLRSLGYELGAVDILQAKTLGGLCRYVKSIVATPHTGIESDDILEGLALAIDSHDWSQQVEAVWECTPTQQAMLAATHSDPEAYCNWIELSISGGVSKSDLFAHFSALAAANEILRTGFAEVQGRLVQVVWKSIAKNQIQAVAKFDKYFQIQNSKQLLRPWSIQLMELSEGKCWTILLKIHHALYDGWTLDLLRLDLDARLRGDDVAERPHFHKIVEHQRIRARSAVVDEARKFWGEALLNFQPAATPELLARADIQQVVSTCTTFELENTQFNKAMKDIHYGPQVIFQAAVLWLWSLLTGNDDVVIGTAGSGRTTAIPGVEAIMGPLLEIMPLRTNFGQLRSIKDLLHTVHASSRAALPHAFLPLSEIKKASNIPAGQALYSVLFTYQESLFSDRKRASVVKEVAHLDFLETGLVFEVEPVEGSFNLQVTYHTSIWSPAIIKCLIGHMGVIVSSMIKDVDTEVSALSINFPETLLSRHNVNPSRYTQSLDVSSTIEHLAAQNPNDPALRFATSFDGEKARSTTVTFDALNREANRIARRLRDLGARPGTVIAIIMEKSVLLYTAILGIVKGGYTYLPLLPSTPRARVDLILGQANVHLCVTDTRTAPLLQGTPCRVVDLQNEDLDAFDDDNLGNTIDMSGVANIIYTSGSTGVPKGVKVTHLNIMSNINVLSRIYPTTRGSRLLQSCSQAFDVSVFEIFFTWTQGMCLCAAVNDVLFEDLERAIRALGVTHLSMTPTVAALVNPETVPNVGFLVTSGEAMTEKVATVWSDQLFQGYGPSETTNICTVKKMHRGDRIRHLGHAFENTSSFVLRPETTETVPICGVGELCFGGDQVTAGYLNLPDLTSEKFINHPGYGRLYRSGDLGRMLPDGSLVILGRMDDQVKLRGQRLELREIDFHLLRSDEVSASITLLVDNSRLVSFVVLRSPQAGGSSQDSELISRLEARLAAALPSYMIPSHIVPLDSLPVTSAGKVDRKRLLLQAESLSSVTPLSAHPDDEEWTEVELQLANILAEALDVEFGQISRWTPLASLGLDSISAIKVGSIVRQRMEQRLSVSAILRNPTVGLLAKGIQGTRPQKDDDLRTILAGSFSEAVVARINSEAGVKGLVIDKILTCTPLQEAMLVASETKKAYVNQLLFRLNIDPDTVADAWKTLIERHAVLRTCFITTDDPQHPVSQVVLHAPYPVLKYLNAPQHSVDELVAEQLTAVNPAIDTFQPPLSIAIIRTSTETFFSFVCHHSLYDGEAMDRLFLEMEQLCHGQPLPDAPLYDPFLAYMLALPDSVDTFWEQHLAGHQSKLLQTPTGAPTQSVSVGKIQGLSDVEDRLKSLGFSSLPLFQSAWSLVLSLLLKSADICFGNVFSGRSVPVEGIESLVAPCFNTVPLRVDLSRIERNGDLIRLYRALNPTMLDYQFTPLRRIQAQYGGRLFDSILLMQQPCRSLDGEIWTLEKEEGDMDFPFACEVVPDRLRNDFEVKLHHTSPIFPETTAQLILDLLSHIVDTLLAYPSSSLLSFRTLPGSLQHRLDGVDLHFDTLTRPPSMSATSKDDRHWSLLEASIRSTFSSLSSVATRHISHCTTIYQLGLDSISAVRVAASLRKQGFKITATDVMAHPTCEELASFIDTHAPDHVETPVFDVSALSKRLSVAVLKSAPGQPPLEQVLPTTPLQANLLAEFLRSSGKNYFNFLTFETGTLGTGEDLALAWRRAMLQLPMLRTGFAQVDDAQSTFAMLQYCSTALPPGFDPVRKFALSHFNVHKWRWDATSAAVDCLQIPPWQVAIVEGDAGVTVQLAIHHALYDATSLQMILTTVQRLLDGDSVDSVHDTAAVVQEVLGQGDDARAHDFWTRLAPDATATRFPTLTSLNPDKSDICTEWALSSASLSSVRDAVRQSGTSIQSVLQATWARILASYSGSQAVTFGVVLSGRTSETTEKACFPCITTLPVICHHVPGNQELVVSMMSYNTDLHQYQHTSLATIHKWLQHSGSPLFDTLLVYQNLEDQASPNHGFLLVEDVASVDYAVSLEIEPRGDSLRLQVTFQDNVLPSLHAKLLLQQFDAVFRHLVFSPDSTEQDLLQTATDLSSVTPPLIPNLPSDIKLVHEFVEAQAASAPGKIALEFVTSLQATDRVSQTWTYQQLNTLSNNAASLIAGNTVPGDIVVTCFDKCPEAYFTILGVLKAGCAFLALDPGAPPARNEFIVQDSGATLLLTDRKHVDKLKLDAQVTTICITERLLDSVPTKRQIAPREARPSDTCYCLYTSGTTGTPKGCEITHENVVQCMLAFQRLFDGHWERDSRWLQFASFHFDVSVLEQYWTWSVGITLVSAPRDLILEDIAGIISRLEITHIDLTPSLARLLDPKDVPSLCRGVFITGGEQLRDDILETWGPTRAIHNFYGPTEATIGVTTYPCVPRNGRSSNIGRQFDNVGTFVLQPGTEIPVLRGGIGELCVSGKLVGKGYLRREALTQERFPTLKVFNERIYRTGDLVRILYDGCFEFLGRADDQVKLRGQRLEIGEINQALRSAKGISDAVTVVIREGKERSDILVSFIVAEANQGRSDLDIVRGPQADDLCRSARAECQARLPGYMVPSFVFQVPFIPLSANNKADLAQLRGLFKSVGPRRFADGIQPDSGKSILTELGTSGKKLVAALKTGGFLSEASNLCASTTIFDLGLDSISVHRLVRGLKRQGISTSVLSVLRYPVIRDLAEHLEQEIDSKTAGSILEARLQVEACHQRHFADVISRIDITADQIEYIAPCSPLQQGMISRGKSLEDAEPYFNAFTFQLHPKTVASKLQKAWEDVVAQTSILRTCFIGTKDGFIQAALKTVPHGLWTDLKTDGRDQLDAALAAHRASWLEKNLDDIQVPLQLVYAQFGEERFVVLQIHHACYDAVSLDLLLNSVAAAYETGAAKPTGSSTFMDALRHGPLQSFASTQDFWRDLFEGVHFSPLPRLATQPSTDDISVTREISVSGLDSVRSALSVTYPAIVQALWMSVLQQVYGESPAIGVLVSGRSLDVEDADQIIGPLLNTLPFRHKGTFPCSWEDLVTGCHGFNNETAPFQHVSLREIQKWCSGGKPLFDTLFSFRAKTESTRAAPKLWTTVESEPNADYPLALEVDMIGQDVLQVELVARRDVADKPSLNRLLDELEAASISMISDPHAFIGGAKTTNGATTNGVAVTPTPERSSSLFLDSNFQWTRDALLIRQEIAALSATASDQINETTTLLELGLDSIDTIKLSARLKHLDIDLRNSQLLKAQCIVGMVKILESSRLANGTVVTNGVHKPLQVQNALWDHLDRRSFELSSVEAVLPCTPLQEAMLADMVHSEFTRYFNHDILELAEGVDIGRLKDAWRQVIMASPILRTTFALVDDPNLDTTYCQVIHQNADVVRIDDSQVSSVQAVQNNVADARQRARRGGGHADVFQLTFARTPEKNCLIISMAHSLYDGWSLGLMHQDVRAAYLNGELAPRPPFVDILSDILQSSGVEAERFWTGYLSNVTPTHIAARPSGVSRQKSSPIRVETVSPLSAAILRDYCKKSAISIQTLCQTCWGAVLSAQVSSLDLIFGTVISGRDSEVAEQIQFPTMNTVAVRLIMHGTSSRMLRYVQETWQDTRRFQQFPLRKAQQLARVGPEGLFNTLFIFQRAPSSDSELPKAPIMKSIDGGSDIDYPLCIEAEIVGDQLLWRSACHNDYLTREDLARLLQQLDVVLRHLVESPEADVLSFGAHGVSVCNLPPFLPRESGSLRPQGATRNTEATDPEWSSSELIIRSVLSDVAGTPEAAIQKAHNLYSLGLDSISGIKVSTILKKEGISLSVRELLASGSIQELATTAARAPVRSDDNSSRVEAVDPKILASIDVGTVLSRAGLKVGDVERVLPATSMQVQMISTWQNSDGAIFFPEFQYFVRGGVNPQSLADAWVQLLRECPILRTMLVATDDKNVPLVQVTLSSVLATVEIRGGAHRVYCSSPESKSPPLLVFSASPKEKDSPAKIAIRIHHALYDAVSLELIMDDFRRLCIGGSSGAEDGGSATSASWTRFTSRQPSKAFVQQRRQFWTRYLKGTRPRLIEQRPISQADHKPNGTTVLSPTGSQVSIFEPATVPNTTALQAWALKRNLGLSAVLFAAYAITLARLGPHVQRQGGVLFGIYLANRSYEDDLTTVPFPTLSLVPLLVRKVLDRDFFDVALGIQHDLEQISTPENASVGLWEIDEWTGLKVESFFNFLRLPELSSSPQSEGGIEFEAVAEQSPQMGAGVAEGDEHDFRRPSKHVQLEANLARRSYPACIDVEVALRSDGALDMGVFGPAMRLDEGHARELMATMGSILSNVSAG